ncbi:MAG: CPBP family intramembrane glutamic endopeptidase [Mucilaginibacter sp.]
MKQLSKLRSVIYHLYPGILITLAFILLAPLGIRYGYPPQFGMLMAVILVALPVLTIHLIRAKKEERYNKLSDLNGLKNRLPFFKLLLYALALVVLAFVIWGITQPVDQYLNKTLFGWLPAWYTVQSFSGYSLEKIKITLVINLIFNGIIAPFAEEVYFRGYLLPRMKSWGKYAFVANAALFSVYHFWQPYVYFTLILSLLPMIYMVYKTKDLRLGILTHSLLNIVGAILSFAMIH